MRLAGVLSAVMALWAGGGTALELSLPSSAVMTREIRQAAGSYRLPTGVYGVDGIPAREVEGALVQQAWRLSAPGLTSLQILGPLRAQVQAEGYDIVLDCAAAECGGFDFRFNTAVMPAPDMFVDLLDYRFVSAVKEGQDGAVDVISLLVSRVSDSGYIQITQASDADGAEVDLAVQADATDGVGVGDTATNAAATTPLAQALTEAGHVVLTDLDFETGTVALGAGPYASLQALAAFLREDENRRIALVGHTDAVGTLENNVALSKRRAAAVLERLVDTYDIPRTRLEAEGMGYLSPVATNRTEAGREANRRVEAVLLSGQ